MRSAAAVLCAAWIVILPVNVFAEPDAAADTARLKSQLEDLENDVKRLRGEKTSIAGTIESLKATASSIEKDVEERKQEISRLEGKLQATKTELAKGRAKLARLRRVLKETQGGLKRAQINRITSETKLSLRCPGTRKDIDGAKSPVMERQQPCDWLVRYPIEELQDYTPQRIYARAVLDSNSNTGASAVLFERALDPTQNFLQIKAEEWSKSVAYGVRYAVYVEYTHAAGSSAGNYRTEVHSFVLKKPAVRLQLTAKVYSVWEPSDDGDQMYIVPGLAAGVGWRPPFIASQDDRDVLGLRLVGAIGPNLVPESEIVTDSEGNPEIKDKRKLQILVGLELALGRYLSAGPAWVVGRGEPLVLITYGDLYPALSP